LRLSEILLPVNTRTPRDAHRSHKLMLAHRLIRQNGAGIYSWLPMGYIVSRRSSRSCRGMNRRSAIEM